MFDVVFRYTDLMEKIPLELKQEWFYAKILQKLGNFGLVRYSFVFNPRQYSFLPKKFIG